MSDQIRLSARQIAGLTGDVTINVDRWGIAHIRADNRHDLFFAQGWNAARDRLWQIDLARKRGLGLLAQDFGPGYLEQDRAARLFLFRGDMSREWAAYGPDSEDICTAFTRGINAYIEACDQGAIALPPEFTLLGYRPARWQAEDVARIRTHSLTRNAASEVLRARIMALAGVEQGASLDRLRKQVSHGVVPHPAAGLDLASIPERVMRDYQLAISPVTFSRERLAATLDEARFWTAVSPLGAVARDAFEEGSNNWAVAAEKAASGRPILALDPHRAHVLPSIRYVVHLTMPGLDVIGAGEPSVPGISMGHNGTAAFGLTIFGADQEDVYCYDMKPDDGNYYAYDGGWERVTTISDIIPVKGCADQIVDLRFTRHGPLLYENRERRCVFALRTVWLDAGMAPYMASLAVMEARNHADYSRALASWGCPSVNHIYADTGNTIAWHPCGATPVRDNWDGLLPVPGDGRYEWQGYLPPEQAPYTVNPPVGFIATANAMNVPEDWSAAHPAIGYEWADSSRHDTLQRELGNRRGISLADCAQLQCSTFSPIASRTLTYLRRLQLLPGAHLSAQSIAAWSLLDGWGGDLAAGSATAALFEVWFSKYLGPLVATREGAAKEVVPLLAPLDPPSIIEWLEAQNLDAALVEAIAESLAKAWNECASRMGLNPADWSWGRIHQLELRHPLQALTEQNWSLPAMALGGSSSTLNLASYRTEDFSVLAGPSVRMVIDVGAWDNSLFVNNPGQSGLPGTAHYSNLNAFWQQGRHCPLLYSRQAVDAATVEQITLSSKLCSLVRKSGLALLR